jgi:uncharacterized membrane protein YqgA involved in biofilm formation
MEPLYCSEACLSQSILVQCWAGGSAVCKVCSKQKGDRSILYSRGTLLRVLECIITISFGVCVSCSIVVLTFVCVCVCV